MSHALQINDLTKTYDGGTKALQGISFSIEEGDFFALLGPNGAGKSTTISIISQLIKKTSGTVEIFGKNIEESSNYIKTLVGLVPQEINAGMFEKVEDVIFQQAGYYGLRRKDVEKRVDVLLKDLGLDDKRETPVLKLSGGMKRRLMIARALIHDPKLLILDEPTAGVDVELRHHMWDFLRKLNESGVTIILTTHYLEEAEKLCRNIAIINKGTIAVSGTMKDVQGDKTLEEVFLAIVKE